jgi:hypothetical protein
MSDLNDYTQNVSLHDDTSDAAITTTTNGAKTSIDVAIDDSDGVAIKQDIQSSLVNLTETNLDSGEVWVGSAEETFGINAIQYYHFADKDCYVYIDQSSDGVNWDVVDRISTKANIGKAEVVQSVAPYYRARVENIGHQTTTVMRFYTGQTPIASPLPRTLSNDGRLKVKATTDNPKTSEGGQNRIMSADDNSRQLLEDILKQMKIMNMHLSILTDLQIDKEEII